MATRLVVGRSDRLVLASDKMHILLTELNISHDYAVLADVDHNLFKIMRPEKDGIQDFLFAARHFHHG